MSRKWKRMLAVFVATTIMAGLLPVLAFDDESAPATGFEYVQAICNITEKKYFMFSEYPILKKLAEGDLGEGAFGEVEHPMIADGRSFIFEFVIEQSTDIRLELWSLIPGANAGDNPQAGEYLGLIAKGFCEGQWGDLIDRDTDERPGVQWFEPPDQGAEKAIANRFHWDGLYWTTNQGGQPIQLRPGIDAPGWDGAQGEFEFIVRFQPTDDEFVSWTTDLPIRVSYTDDDIANAALLRGQYFDSLEASLIRAYSSDPIYMPTGNFTWDYTDIAVYGAQPLGLTRHYNAQGGADGELGHGWRHSFMYSVDVGQLFATVSMADGVTVSYMRGRDGTFTGSGGMPYTLEPYGGGYLFTTLDKTQYYFDNDGLLASVVDVNGNATTITRNGAQITSISNGSGTLTFAYSDGRISCEGLRL